MQTTVIPMTLKQPYDIYIASCDKAGGVYHYQLFEDGRIERIRFIPMDRPMYMTIANHKLYVLLRAPFENSESGMVVCDIHTTGGLTDPSSITSTKGKVACHILVDNETVYCANYLSGSIVKLPDTIVHHSGKSIDPIRQEGPHIHYVGLTSDKQCLCVTDLGLDKNFLYTKDLMAKSAVQLPAGHGPRHLAFHENGKTVFCVNELASTVSVMEYTDETLVLTDTVSALPVNFTGINTAAAIRCNGNTVYTSNRGHDSVSVFTFSGNKLIFNHVIPTYGKGPRDFWIEDDLLVAANETGNKLTFVSISSQKLYAEIKIKSPVCVLMNAKKALS